MRVMVGMSATLIHYGHVRLLRKARTLGGQRNTVVVALSLDEGVRDHKGFRPEIPYEGRAELLLALEDVDEVVPTPPEWFLDDDFLKTHGCDILLAGHDCADPTVFKEIVPRTEDISSSVIRERAAENVFQKRNRSNTLLTPGPSSLIAEGIVQGLAPLFGRGDDRYASVEQKLLDHLLGMSEQDEVIPLQGSATLAIEMAITNYASGDVCVIGEGYYTDRLVKIIEKAESVGRCHRVSDTSEIPERIDWIACCYVETSLAYKNDIEAIAKSASRSNAKLFLDATASIGLEDGHGVADLIAFSSCKGLFGLTGASFIGKKKHVERVGAPRSVYLDIDNHRNRQVTGPYHQLAGLLPILENHQELRNKVLQSKEFFTKRYQNMLVHPTRNQPALCTLVSSHLTTTQTGKVVMYQPRIDLPGSIVCHLADAALEQDEIGRSYDLLQPVS